MRVNSVALNRWHALPAIDVLHTLSECIKRDPSFHPRASHGTSRWHVSIQGRDYEVLCSGTKFFDTRSHRGGGGAIDMVMHFNELTFIEAVRYLERMKL